MQMKTTDVIPRARGDEDYGRRSRSVSHNSGFLAPLGMTPEMMLAADA